MVQTNEVGVLGNCSMTNQRQQVIIDWFSRQDHTNDIGTLEAAEWLKGVFGGEWVVNKTTQDGTQGRHWTYSTLVDPDYWIEIAVGEEWYYLMFKIK